MLKGEDENAEKPEGPSCCCALTRIMRGLELAFSSPVRTAIAPSLAYITPRGELVLSLLIRYISKISATFLISVIIHRVVDVSLGLTAHRVADTGLYTGWPR